MSGLAVHKWIRIRALERVMRLWRGSVIRNVSHETDMKKARVVRTDRIHCHVFKRWRLRTVEKLWSRKGLQTEFAAWRDKVSLFYRFYGLS
jgi:nitrate/TMAO reductase-like tetraheme cytochrome c subunit